MLRQTVTLALTPFRSQWQGLGYDKHSIIATPSSLFVDPANNDFHLKAGSAAIDAGTSLTGITADLEGVSRPQGNAFDIGCYEYRLSSPVATKATDTTQSEVIAPSANLAFATLSYVVALPAWDPAIHRSTPSRPVARRPLPQELAVYDLDTR